MKNIKQIFAVILTAAALGACSEYTCPTYAQQQNDKIEIENLPADEAYAVSPVKENKKEAI